MTSRDVKKLAKKMLSSDRYEHEKQVVKTAIKLAKRYGADVKQAKLAAWLHDIVKEEPRERLLQLMAQNDIMNRFSPSSPPAVWHGPCAAIYARNELGISDEAVLQAVAFHTTGKPDMSLLEKILFVADIISEDRNYGFVEQIRQLAYQNLDQAVQLGLQQNIEYVRQKDGVLDEQTLQALQWFCKV